MVGGGGSWKAAKKLIAQTCGSFSWNTNSRRNPTQDDVSANNAAATAHHPKKHNICAICLDPLNYNNSGSGSGSGSPLAIFTAQCSHAFHFSCISSNVRHGSVTCPVCRAHWTHLPRNANSLHSDPILQILDDSIATFRFHRRSFLLSARYDDDDPLHPHPHHHTTTTTTTSSYHRLRISLLPTSSDNSPRRVRAYLCVRLDHQPATDLVLVATPNGPHLRLMKQAMALVILSLRPEDRLSIVTYSSAAAASRMFPLKRMTSYGKRRALQVIDRLFYTGSADPSVGLKKGIKVLNDRVYRNPESHVLHLSDTPTWSYNNFNLEAAVKIHRFHIGFGFGMHEFEKFLAGMLGGAITDIQLKMKEDRRVIKLGELRGGEERRVPLLLRRSAQYCVEYSYVDNGGGTEGCSSNKTGEMLIGIDDDDEEEDDDLETNQMMMMSGGRRSSAESWEYHDTFMARRWAKHLHGNR